MVRVLMINYEYPPLGGGTAIANQYLLKEFTHESLAVDLLTSAPGKFIQSRLSPNIRLIRLDIGKNNQNLHHQSYLDLFRFFWQSTFWIMKHKNNYDLIHAFSGLPGSVSAWLSGNPYLVSFRGADEPGYESRHALFWQFFKPLIGFIYRRARSLDANSLFLKQLVSKSWPDLKIQIIRNGVDTVKFYPAKKPVKQPIILSTSRFGQRKGVEYLIRAMALVPKAKLLLAGSGKLEPKIKQLVRKLHLSNRVKFLGLVPHEQLPPLYRRTKVFVLPSLSESQSNSFLEALACGLPVVATNVGGNPELVNSSNGILVPAADSQSLTEAITQSLSQNWPKITVEKKFFWQKTANEYLKIYRQYSQPKLERKFGEP